MASPPASLLITGTGALASLFAARLAESGVQVTLLGTWPEGLKALQTHGVQFVDQNGEKSYPVQVSADPAACRPAPLALVLVKSWQTERVAGQLGACLSPDGLALTLQNGLGNRETLAEALGPGRVALGTTTVGATLLAPGRVRAGGEGTISLENHARIGPLQFMLAEAGFPTAVVDDVDSLLWGKLAINAAINPLTALLRVPNGELLERPSARSLMETLAQEVADVAAALGISLPFPDPAASAEAVARRTAANHSSMFQDVLRGAPTEIDAICGAVARAGASQKVPTPANQILWQLVSAL